MTPRHPRPKKKMKKKGRPTALDLFAGAGGFTVGFEAAGFQSVAAVELNEPAARTWACNFPEGHLWAGREGDMRTLDPREVKRVLELKGVKELDVITAGPPCQGFSRAGRAKLDSLAALAGAFKADPRNILYRRAIEYLEVLKPRAFIFENVTGILHLAGTNMAEVICRAVSDSGYEVRCAILNAAWYGVPQNRERVFILGIRSDLGAVPRFPMVERSSATLRGLLSNRARLAAGTWQTDEFFVPWSELPHAADLGPAVGVEEALRDLPVLTHRLGRLKRENVPAVPYRGGRPSAFGQVMRSWRGIKAKLVSDHLCRLTPRDYETFALMEPGDRYPEALKLANQRWKRARATNPKAKKASYVPPYRDDGFPDKWRKLIPDQPSWTVTAHLGRDTYSHIHYDDAQARMVTVREAARLQSFPDGFAFTGSMGDAFTQIGNAVPPLLAQAVGTEMRRVLESAEQRVGRKRR